MAFQRGQGGRPRGARNRVTRELQDVLDKFATRKDLHAKRLHQLTQSEDEHVAIKALALILAYRFGRPPESLELTGKDEGPVLVKFVDVDAAA